MNDETTTTLADFVKERGIRMRAKRVDCNPNMESDAPMDHWRCVFTSAERRRLSVYFSMGVGLGGVEPQAEDVLDCLASDSVGVENARDFKDWCADYGYDPDSRKAERTFRVCRLQAAKLKQFLGDAAYKNLLWNVERL